MQQRSGERVHVNLLLVWEVLLRYGQQSRNCAAALRVGALVVWLQIRIDGYAEMLECNYHNDDSEPWM